jgi:hypothetical protein
MTHIPREVFPQCLRLTNTNGRYPEEGKAGKRYLFTVGKSEDGGAKHETLFIIPPR